MIPNHVLRVLVGSGFLILAVYEILFNKRAVRQTIESYEFQIRILRSCPWILIIFGLSCAFLGILILVT